MSAVATPSRLIAVSRAVSSKNLEFVAHALNLKFQFRKEHSRAAECAESLIRKADENSRSERERESWPRDSRRLRPHNGAAE